MANEAVQVEGPYEVHDFTVNATAVPKFTLMTVSGSTTTREAKASSGASEVFFGIAASEQTAGSTSTNLGLWTKGTFDLVNSTTVAIAVGALVSLSGSNMIKVATSAEILTGDVVGKAWEQISGDAAGEVHVGEFI